MKTDELIARLVTQLQPVRPLPSLGRRALFWLAIVVPVVVVAVLLFEPRADLGARLVQVDFVWTLVAGIVVGTCASVAALVLALPGAERTPVLRGVVWCLVSAWGFGLGTLALSQGSLSTTDTHWPVCSLRVIAVAIMPALVLGTMVGRGAVLRSGLTGLFVTLAAAAMATVAVQMACPIDEAGHGLKGHFAPVLALGLAGYFVGRSTLRLRNARGW